jgi:hypothetical protein
MTVASSKAILSKLHRPETRFADRVVEQRNRNLRLGQSQSHRRSVEPSIDIVAPESPCPRRQEGKSTSGCRGVEGTSRTEIAGPPRM